MGKIEDEFLLLSENIERIVETIKNEPIIEEFPDSLNRKVILRPHDKPDPDAISSAIALSKEFKRYEVDSIIMFHRESPFYENQALHNILDLKATCKIVRLGNLLRTINQRDLENIISSNKCSVLLDTSSINVNSPDYKVFSPTLIVDHHNGNPTSFKNAQKILPDTGANISFLITYLATRDFNLSSPDNQALRISAYLGIETDTSGFMNELMTGVDMEAKKIIESSFSSEDFEIIEHIKSPTIERHVKRTYGSALMNHESILDDKLSIYCVPEIITDSAVIPYIADRFFKEDRLGKAVIVFGISDSLEDDVRYLEVIASGRSLDPSINMPDLFEETFYMRESDGKRKKYSGGSSTAQTGMSRAGATIPLPEFEEYTQDQLKSLWDLEGQKYLKRIYKRFQIK